MSKEYPCIYYENKMCKKFSDDTGTSYCVQGPCPYETPSNADHIRSMTDEKLASVIVRYEGTELHATRWGGHKHFFFGADGKRSKTRKEAVRSWADWLNQPYKEG